MSPYESILGLSGLWIQRVERHKDIHVWARPTQGLASIHCQHADVRIKATHRRTLKYTRRGDRSASWLHSICSAVSCAPCSLLTKQVMSASLRPFRLSVWAHERPTPVTLTGK